MKNRIVAGYGRDGGREDFPKQAADLCHVESIFKLHGHIAF